MSDQSAHEPTMEEILASIRRIISEDDAPEETANKPSAGVEAEPEPVFEVEPEIEAEPDAEDVLELTDPYVSPVASIGDLDAYEPAPAVAPKAEPKPVYQEARVDYASDRLVSDRTENSAASAFGALSNALLVPKDGRTLEDVLKELLRPLLQEWLDKNLSSIVEEQVRTEVERIARQARR